MSARRDRAALTRAAPLDAGGVRWWPGPGVERARLAALAQRALAARAAGAANRKDDRRKASFLLALDGPAPDHLLKVAEYGALAPWRRLRRSKARRELAIAAALAERGVAAPVAVAAGEERRGALLVRCFELVPWLPDAADLRRVRSERSRPPGERRRLAHALGALVRRMHDAGLDQEDLAPNNFLWRPGRDPELLAIDFERARLRARVAPAARVRSLAKLDRHCAGASLAERMRFVLGYTSGSRSEARGLWRAVERDAARLLRRDAARWTRTATRPGRRFEPFVVEAGAVTWRGWRRRDAAPTAIRERLETAAAPAAGPLWLRPLGPLREREAARAFGMALALHQRGVLPEPVATLRGAGGACLLLSAPPDAGALGAPTSPAVGASLASLLDRLLAWGGLRADLRRDAFAVSGGRVWLLDPLALDLRVAPLRDGRANAARLRAAALLGAARSLRRG